LSTLSLLVVVEVVVDMVAVGALVVSALALD
jgi:hypothetical protein